MLVLITVGMFVLFLASLGIFCMLRYRPTETTKMPIVKNDDEGVTLDDREVVPFY